MTECLVCKENLPESGGKAKLRLTYNLRCLNCCVALVASARPNKRAQEGFLAVIAKTRDSPTKERIVEALKATKAIKTRATK